MDLPSINRAIKLMSALRASRALRGTPGVESRVMPHWKHFGHGTALNNAHFIMGQKDPVLKELGIKMPAWPSLPFYDKTLTGLKARAAAMTQPSPAVTHTWNLPPNPGAQGTLFSSPLNTKPRRI